MRLVLFFNTSRFCIFETMKKLLLFFIGFFTLQASAQITVSGTAIDTEKKPVAEVTVFVTLVKDSTLVNYATTDTGGKFSLSLKPVNDSVTITLSLMGYKDKVYTYPKLTQNTDLGRINLEEDSNLLSEIVIVTDAPVRVKNDTLEFNASSFKVRPDANVEALLKQLPGVEIDADKNITVNGKKVSQILVNGKPFFNKDGSVALQNLPAELIKKVQVTDLKTKTEEFSGRKAQSDDASINLTIDEDKNKGLLGKIMAGYGTDERYESSGMLNYFKGDRRITILASSNNINSASFSMDEVFDNMGRGRSQFLSFGGRGGGAGLGSFLFGSNQGITRSNLLGFTYADQFFKDLETNASYYLNDSHKENQNRSRIENLLPDGTFITESDRKQKTDNLSHNANFTLEYKINPTTKVFIQPSITTNKNRSVTEEQSVSKDMDGNLFNESNGRSVTDMDSFSFSNSIEFNKKLDKNGKNLSIEFDNDNSKTTGLGRTESATYFYQGQQEDDIRNQQEISRNTSDTYTTTINYSQPIVKDTYVDLGYTFEYNNQTDRLHTYNFDETANDFSSFNERLSNETHTTITTSTPFAGFNIQSEKVYWNLRSGVNIAKLNANAGYMGQEYSVDRKFLTPFIRANFRYKFTASDFLFARYNYNVTNPSAMQILDYERLNDPLNTYIGNADIDQAKNHSLTLGYRSNNFQLRKGWSIFLSADYYESQIAVSTVFDENRKRTTTYQNVEGAYNISANGDWYKSKKWEAHTVRFGLSTRISYALEKGFTNGVLYDAQTIGITPRAYLNWDYGDFLTVSPSYSLSYNHSEFNNYQLTDTDYVVHNAMLQTTTYWPENWTWGNDFTYTYNSRLTGGFRKDFFLWNTSLAYTFLNKALTAKVKVYDILNQNLGISRTVSATAIVDQENTVLKRYVMFSLTYKFDRFGTGKQNSRNERREGFRVIRR